MKTVKVTKNIESILNVTKNVIKQSTEFHDYYKNKDNNLFQSQLPLLIQRSRIREALYDKNKNKVQDLVLLHKSIEEQDSNNDNNNTKNEEEEKNIYNKLSLTEIRKHQVRSKKLPPLCPFYNKKGELLPEVVSTAKAFNNMEADSKFNLYNTGLGKIFPSFNWHFLTPMNKSKIKSINLYENIDIKFEDFQKEVLYEKHYDNLTYDYKDIYGRKSFYKEVINNSVEEINKLTSESQLIEEGNKIVENQETKKDKIFEWGKNKKNILLSLHSINIKITSIENNNIIFDYNLPLNLVPLFYYKGFEKFKIFIMALITWDEKNKKFNLVQNIYTVINNLLNNCREFKQKFDLLEELETKDESIIKAPELKKTMTFGKNTTKGGGHNLAKSMINMGAMSNNLFAGTNVDIIQKKKMEKKTYKLYPKEEKDDDYLNYNNFNFYWKTKDNCYQVNVDMPLIVFNIPSYNINVKQYIDFELLFYLFSNKFENWDFYVIKYISSFKLFRIILSQIASFNQKKNINIFLENPKTKNYDNSDEKITSIYTIENSADLLQPKNKIDLDNVDKIQEEEKEHNDSDVEENTKKDMSNINTVNTVQTEETLKSMNIKEKSKKNKGIINTIIEQKCFRALVTINDMDKLIANEYEIHFNYKQFNKFKFIEKYMDKISFLIKFLDINYEANTIKFDYDSLNIFNEKLWILQLEKYNKNPKSNLVESIIGQKLNNENSIKISKINIKSKKNNKNNVNIKVKEIEDEKNLNNNLNNHNRAEFVGVSKKHSLVVEIKEPAIFLKYLENEGKIKLKKFNVLEEDENRLISKKHNVVDIIKTSFDLSQNYIQKEKEKKVEVHKTMEKNLYYSYNKKFVK